MAQANIAADIAYVATAGAAGLALAVSAWAARLHKGIKRREQAIELQTNSALIQSAACAGALNAFDDLRMALAPDGSVSAVYGPYEPLFLLTDQPMTAPGQPSQQDIQSAADQLTARLKRLHPSRMIALLQEGQ